jgi:uncharacterized phiE125 gp8 family phage protein
MLIQVEAPTVEPVTLEQAKAHLAIDADDFDDLLSGYIASIRAYLDGRDGILGRALIAQTWDYKLPCFPSVIELPLPPLQSVTSITYTDANGDTQTLSPSAYQVSGIGGSQRGCIAPAYGTRWPVTRDMPEAVTVRFVAGYPDDGGSPPDLAANVPPAIKQAIMEMVADLWANRETVSPDQTYAVVMPATAKALLAPFKAWRFT